MFAMNDLSHGVRRAASSVNSGSKLSNERLDFCGNMKNYNENVNALMLFHELQSLHHVATTS